MIERQIHVTKEQVCAWLGLPTTAKVSVGIPCGPLDDGPDYVVTVYTDAPVTAPRTSPLTEEEAQALAMSAFGGSLDRLSIPAAHRVIANLVADLLRVDSEARAADSELAADRDRWKTAYETATEPRLLELHIENGVMEGRIDGRGIARIIAAAFWDLLTKEKAQNYVEMTLERGGQELLVHVQKRTGKTPHALRDEAERERDKARADLDEAVRQAVYDVLDDVADLDDGETDVLATVKMWRDDPGAYSRLRDDARHPTPSTPTTTEET